MDGERTEFWNHKSFNAQDNVEPCKTDETIQLQEEMVRALNAKITSQKHVDEFEEARKMRHQLLNELHTADSVLGDNADYDDFLNQTLGEDNETDDQASADGGTLLGSETAQKKKSPKKKNETRIYIKIKNIEKLVINYGTNDED